MNKYIYKMYVDTKNEIVVKERFPIVYESNKEIICAIGNGETLRVYKNSAHFFISISKEQLKDIFKNRFDRICFTLSCYDNFNGKKAYININEQDVNTKLAQLKMKMDSAYNAYKDAKKEYESALKYYNKEEENGYIK